MKILLIIFIAVYFTACATNPQPIWWIGPEASITSDMKIRVNGTNYVPFFLSVNPQAITQDSDWDTLLYQVDLAIAHHVVILEVMFSNNTPEFMQLLSEKLGDRKVYLFAKMYVGTESDDITDAWLANYVSVLQQFITDLNTYLPGKVIGMRTMALTSGEWFQIPSSPDFAKKVSFSQVKLASIIKDMTSNRCLTVVNAGYLLAFSAMEGGSHVEFEEILTSPVIDIVSSPYEYVAARNVNQPFLQQLVIDSIPLHHKLLLTEDDTRTSFAAVDQFKSCYTIDCDIQIMKRNIKAALEHNTGLYFLDLPNKGWFGRADRAAASQALWDAIEVAINEQAEPTTPQIAVFFDTDTMKTIMPSPSQMGPFVGTDGNNYAYEGIEAQILALENTGLGVRYYLLSDRSKLPAFSQEVIIK